MALSDMKPARESEILKHYFLREFQDWKTRSRKDHSIKVLKSNKKPKGAPAGPQPIYDEEEGEANFNVAGAGGDVDRPAKNSKNTKKKEENR